MDACERGWAPTRDPFERSRAGIHRARLHSNERFLVDSMVEFAADALDNGDPLIVITSGPRHRLLRNRLGALGLDWDGARASGRGAFHDVQDLLPEIMERGCPHTRRFRSTIERILAPWDALPPRRRLSVYGGLVDPLWRSGQHEAVIQLEQCWSDVTREKRITLRCGYRIGGLHREINSAVLGRIEDLPERVGRVG